MQAKEFFREIDELYELNPQGVEAYLLKQNEEAIKNGDIALQLMIINELIGYYRSRSMHQEAIDTSFKAITLLGEAGLIQDLQGATTLLNCATAFKVAGCFEEAKILYERCLMIYNQTLDKKDERFASLYNNMSDLYLQLNDTHRAKEMLFKALDIVDDERWATSMTNLGGIYLQEGNVEKAYEVLIKAQEVFSEIEDPHYGVCLLYLGKIKQSIEDYEHGLALIRYYFNKNDDFKAGYQEYVELLKSKGMIQRYELALKSSVKGLKLSETYYKEIAEPILKQAFPNLFSKMTIGLIGEGSECFKMDDTLSQDHDFYPRFLILVDEDTSEEDIKRVQNVYDQLPDYYLGYRKVSSLYVDKRDGVFKIESYFKQHLGFHYTLNNSLDWFYFDENKLALLYNGKIFKEGDNLFNEYKKRYQYYDEDVRLKKIMSCIAKMAQSGQYNYARMMKRHDMITAQHAQAEFIEETLKLIYLLNKVYCPYYKWRYKLAKTHFPNEKILDYLEKLVQTPFDLVWYKEDQSYIHDPKVKWIEEICKEVVFSLQAQHLTNHNATFLQNHLENIRECIQDKDIKKMHVMEG